MSLVCFSKRRSRARVSWCRHSTTGPWAINKRDAVEAHGSNEVSSVAGLVFALDEITTPLALFDTDRCREMPTPADIAGEVGWFATVRVSAPYKLYQATRKRCVYLFGYATPAYDMIPTKLRQYIQTVGYFNIDWFLRCATRKG